MIRFEPASRENAAVLAEVSRRTFDNDVNFGAPGPCGPPGYDSPEWQRHCMRAGRYFEICDDNRIIGGLMLFPQGAGTVELGRVFIEPERQNTGIGLAALRFAESAFPKAKRWVLDTPAWNTRNHHFYEKAGYVKTGEIEAGDGFVLFQFEKIIA